MEQVLGGSLMRGYRGATLLLTVNWDLIFTLGTVVLGLLAGAFLGTTLTAR